MGEELGRGGGEGAGPNAQHFSACFDFLAQLKMHQKT